MLVPQPHFENNYLQNNVSQTSVCTRITWGSCANTDSDSVGLGGRGLEILHFYLVSAQVIQILLLVLGNYREGRLSLEMSSFLKSRACLATSVLHPERIHPVLA